MTVHFIGAGPGAADLITVRGRDLIARCPVCLYAGSIVPKELLAYCPPGARIVDTAPMSLDEIEAEFVAAHEKGLDVARLHSGDLSIYSALAEQLRRLERLGIAYTLTPGVPAFAAAAAALGRELTVPELTQSVVLTRMPGRASTMPEKRKARGICRNRRDIGHSSGDPVDRRDRRGAIPGLWRGLSDRRYCSRELAGATHYPRRYCARSSACSRPSKRSNAPRSFWSGGRWRRMISAKARYTIRIIAAGFAATAHE